MSALALAPEAPSLVELLLAEQQRLPAVERFARSHEAGAIEAGAASWRELIPLERAPGAGEQLAFQVDLDACTGCKACVTACHSLNGLGEEETWRQVGLLVGEGPTGPVQQTVTTSCHHCEDPGCLAGCPVQAYEKDPVTGIVRHLDDQCIGCQYCLLTCPYDVPQYSASLGIVRKCDMCTGRLAEGEAPACVQGCPNGAISIAIVAVGGAERPLLPAAEGAVPDAGITRPSTRYRTAREAASLRPADAGRLRPAKAHDPLAVMLVMLQLSVGTLLFDTALAVLGAGAARAHAVALAVAVLAGAAGLGAATLHLGRPLYAFRAFLGWRTSWMSREILVLSAYLPAVGLAAAAAWSGIGAAWLPALRAAALVAGLAGSACSVMIYVDTRRAAWAPIRTAALFAGTLLGLGAVAAGVAHASPGLLVLGAAAIAAKLAFEADVESRRGADPLARSAALLRGPLARPLRLRKGLAVLGLALALLAALAAAGALLAFAAALVLLLGEGVERHLFFRSEASAAMPGL